MAFDVIGLGFTSVDYIGIVPELPRLDEGTRILDFTRQGGGPVAQALVTLARLGASAGFVGRVGDDEAGAFMRRGLANEGVDLSRLQVERGATSGQCIILVHAATGKRSICFHPGTISPIDADALDAGYLCSGRFLHLDGYAPQAAMRAATVARAAGVQVCLDAGGFGPHIADLAAVADVLIAGEQCARVVGGGDYRDGACRLLAMGPGIVTVTLGADGSFTKTREEEFSYPAFAVPVVDTTGAGDVFHGAYLFGLLQGWSLEAVVPFASAAAALKCQQLGGRAGIPNYSAVVAFLRQRAPNHIPGSPKAGDAPASADL